MLRQLSRLRLLVTLAVVLVAIYRLGLRGWLARQERWEWGLVATMLAIFAALIGVQRVQQATLLLTIAWVASGLAATGASRGCAGIHGRTRYRATGPPFR